jgi:pimeloyl-ACP methyl ester carboxylesterase
MPHPDPSAAPGPDAQSLLARLPTYLHVSDIQGLAQLATQGVLGVAGLAEAVHGNVYKTVAASLPGGAKFIDQAPGSSGIRPMGITALVYGGVKGITRLAGGTVNAVLARAAPLLPKPASAPAREAVLAAINGVLGDRLLDTANPLTISMSLRHEGQSLVLDKTILGQRLPKVTGKVLVLAHGLCMNDLQWGAGHASALAREGYTPIYLHYNSGLHTSINGAQLSALLEQLLQAWPQPVESLTLLAHSMGGLVARSAAAQAQAAGHPWRSKLKNIVFLGTPHHGAPLERLGNWVDVLLGSNLVTRPFAKIGQVRSSGITDLRYGCVQSADWEGLDRFVRSPDSRAPLPLPDGVNCFTVAASTARNAGGLGDVKDWLLGDGLVPVRSALGQHDEAQHCLAFAPGHQTVLPGINHIELLSSPAVTAQLVQWLGHQPAAPMA